MDKQAKEDRLTILVEERDRVRREMHRLRVRLALFASQEHELTTEIRQKMGLPPKQNAEPKPEE